MRDFGRRPCDTTLRTLQLRRGWGPRRPPLCAIGGARACAGTAAWRCSAGRQPGTAQGCLSRPPRPGDIWHQRCPGPRHPQPNQAVQNPPRIWLLPNERSPVHPGWRSPAWSRGGSEGGQGLLPGPSGCSAGLAGPGACQRRRVTLLPPGSAQPGSVAPRGFWQMSPAARPAPPARRLCQETLQAGGQRRWEGNRLSAKKRVNPRAATQSRISCGFIPCLPAGRVWGRGLLRGAVTRGGMQGSAPTGGSLLHCRDRDVPPPWPCRARAAKRRAMLCWRLGYQQCLPAPKAQGAICSASGGQMGLGRSRAAAPGVMARGARKRKIKADASSPAPAAAQAVLFMVTSPASSSGFSAAPWEWGGREPPAPSPAEAGWLPA